MYLPIHDLRLHQMDNYIRTSNTHIFFGFTEENIQLIDQFPHADIHVHIFIGNDHDISNRLNHAVHSLITKTTANSKIVIHIPKFFKEFAPIVKDMFADVISTKKLIIVTEKSGPSFLIDNYRKYYLDVEYNEFFIRGKIVVAHHDTLNTNGGTFQNELQRNNPEKFKDQLIANFKARTPMSILRSFKSEEEIWEFIMEYEQSPDSKKDEIRIPRYRECII